MTPSNPEGSFERSARSARSLKGALGMVMN